jgi:hypothetical protein
MMANGDVGDVASMFHISWFKTEPTVERMGKGVAIAF